jgi:uncharacterized protein (TIGR03437 family)
MLDFSAIQFFRALVVTAGDLQRLVAVGSRFSWRYCATLLVLALACALVDGVAAAGTVRAVKNAGSGHSGNVAPGSLATIFGDNLAAGTESVLEDGRHGREQVAIPRALGGVSVTINGSAARLLYVSPDRIDLQIPGEVGTGQAILVVTTSGVASAPFSFTLIAAAPGILLEPNSTHAIASLEDGTAVSDLNPAAPGSRVIVSLTGAGYAGKSTLAFSATIGGKDAAVQSIVPVRDELGVARATITVPDVSAGRADYPVVITVGGVASESALVRVDTTTLTPGGPSPIKRYVVGNAADDSSYLEFSGLSPIGAAVGLTGYSGSLWQSANCPVDDNNGSTDLGGGVGIGLHLQNCASFGFTSFGTEATPIHHTDTIDYWTILQGEVDLITDKDTVHLKAGDTVVVRGSHHAWSKTSKEPCIGIDVSVKANPLPGQSGAPFPPPGGIGM